MKHAYLTFVLALSVVLLRLSTPPAAYAALPTIDVAAIQQLLVQIEKFRSMIAILDNSKDLLIRQFEIMERDNTNLGMREMMRFMARYRDTYSSLQRAIDGYKGLYQQIDRLDEIFPRLDLGFGEDQICTNEVEMPDGSMTCEEDVALGETHRILKKQLLISRQQMKHALKVGSQVLEQLPRGQEELEYALMESRGAVGVLQAAQSGNEIMGLVGQRLQTLSVQLGTFVQAYSTKELADQGKESIALRRKYDFLQDLRAPRDVPPVDMSTLNPSRSSGAASEARHRSTALESF